MYKKKQEWRIRSNVIINKNGNKKIDINKLNDCG